jgi:DNA-binding CsgD family transcriptional regulator
MTEEDLYGLLRETADAAIVITARGNVLFCNAAFEELFGKIAGRLASHCCAQLLQGTGAFGELVCHSACSVLESVKSGQPVPSFDLEVRTPAGLRWCNVSTLVARTSSRTVLLTHLIRNIDAQTRLANITAEFLTKAGALTADKAGSLLTSAATPRLELTPKERAILGALVRGSSTRRIAQELNISNATVRNHIQHILNKLAAHSRMEAVLHAIHDRLI